MSNTGSLQITDEHRSQVKTLKKELKSWEHAYLEENGRKPDKQDIAAVPEMAKKYKLYAKLKAQVEAADAAISPNADSPVVNLSSPDRKNVETGDDNASVVRPGLPPNGRSHPPRPSSRTTTNNSSARAARRGSNDNDTNEIENRNEVNQNPNSRMVIPLAPEARRMSQEMPATSADQQGGSASSNARRGSALTNATRPSDHNEQNNVAVGLTQGDHAFSLQGKVGVKASIIDKSYLISTTTSTTAATPSDFSKGSNDAQSSNEMLSMQSNQRQPDTSHKNAALGIEGDVSGLPSLPIKFINKKTVATGAMTTADLGQGSLNKFARRAQQQQQQRQADVANESEEIHIEATNVSKASDHDLDGIANIHGYSSSGISRYPGDNPPIPSAETDNTTDSELRGFVNRRKEIENIKSSDNLAGDGASPLSPVLDTERKQNIPSDASGSTKTEAPKAQVFIQSQATSNVIQVKSYGPSPGSQTGNEPPRPTAPDTRKSSEQLARQPTTPLDPKSPADGAVSAGNDGKDRPPTSTIASKGWIDRKDLPAAQPPPAIPPASIPQIIVGTDHTKQVAAPTNAPLPINTTPVTAFTKTPDPNDANSQSSNAAVAQISKLPSIVTQNMFLRLPKDGILRCRLMRRKNLLDKANPTYLLHNEVEDKFMLSARKKLISKSVNFTISDSPDDISKDSSHYLAKLKGNFKRNSFVLTDMRNSGKQRELAMINYAKNVLPRELQVAIPSSTIDENAETGYSTDIMSDFKVKNTNKLLFIKNKAPRWNETTQSHCLNFGGRVTQPSIKNMQLIPEGDENYIILQFGRCGPDWFTLDARWPMTPMEAFAIALSTFDAYDNA